MELRLAVVQPETLTGPDAPKNVDRAVAYIRQAARDGAKLVMLPETYPGPCTVPVDYSRTRRSPLSRARRTCTWSAAPSSTSARTTSATPPATTASTSTVQTASASASTGGRPRRARGSMRAGSSGTSSTRKRTSCRCGTRSSASSAS
ncbi:MAG: carbon-nitrogen hydrolase family protein [Actinobacteria bacterium]|nr:MAG: carbon-nitrogen hydrolase family protein [Actinomycetota bacterium]